MTEHYCRIRYVVTCSECGDIAEVETISDGSKECEAHEQPQGREGVISNES